jgi:hypothetical protein
VTSFYLLLWITVGAPLGTYNEHLIFPSLGECEKYAEGLAAVSVDPTTYTCLRIKDMHRYTGQFRHPGTWN